MEFLGCVGSCSPLRLGCFLSLCSHSLSSFLFLLFLGLALWVYWFIWWYSKSLRALITFHFFSFCFSGSVISVVLFSNCWFFLWLAHNCWWIPLVIFYFSFLLTSSRFSIWFFFIIRVSLLMFSFCSHIIFPVSFYSLGMASFSFLSIFNVVDLMSLSSNSSEWASSGMIFCQFFPFDWAIFSCFIVGFVSFSCWKLDIEYCGNSRNLILSVFRDCWFCLLTAGTNHWWLSQIFLQSRYSLCVVNEVFISLSLWSASDLIYLYKYRSREVEWHTKPAYVY